MSKSIPIIVALILGISLLLFSMTYTVRFHEVAIRTRFGKTTPDSVVKEPGLQFKLPLFMDKVTTLDTRLQVRESPLETVQTSDGQLVVVRAFFTWKVDGDEAVRFQQTYGSIDGANAELGDRFRTALRWGLSRFAFDDLIGPNSKLAAAEQAVNNELASLRTNGIEPMGVGISQLTLPQNTTKAVLTRMQTTRNSLAENERQKGATIAVGITSRAGTQVDKIRTFATLRAQEIRAQGDLKAAEYLAKMSKEQDLAIFLSWLDALQSTLSEYTTLVIPTAFAPFHMMHLNTLTDARGIPQPTEGLDTVTVEAPAPAKPVQPAAASRSSSDAADAEEDRQPQADIDSKRAGADRGAANQEVRHDG